MAVVLYDCLSCYWFGTSKADLFKFKNHIPKHTYDYRCPMCGSSAIIEEAQDSDDYYSDIESTNWGDE